MKSNEVYGIITDGLYTIPREMHGVNTDDNIEMKSNEVYGITAQNN